MDLRDTVLGLRAQPKTDNEGYITVKRSSVIRISAIENKKCKYSERKKWTQKWEKGHQKNNVLMNFEYMIQDGLRFQHL